MPTFIEFGKVECYLVIPFCYVRYIKVLLKVLIKVTYGVDKSNIQSL